MHERRGTPMTVVTEVGARPSPSRPPFPSFEPPAEDPAAPGRHRVASFLARNAFVILVLGVGGAALMSLMRSRIAGDSWYTLLSGRLIVQSGLPHHDHLSV